MASVLAGPEGNVGSHTSPDEFLGALFSVQGQRVLITGAGSGLGQAMAVGFACAGASLILVDVDDSALERTSALLPPGVPRLLRTVDISSDSQVEALFADLASEGLDVAINNAGVLSEYSIFEMSVDQWDRVMSINLRGQMLCIQAAMKVMRTRGGSIINIGSSTGSRGAALNKAFTAPDYVAAKAGVQALTRFCAQNGALHDIRVNAIAPGPVATPMHAHHMAEFEAAVVATIPLGRLQRVEDIVGIAIYLASSAAAYVTGQTFHINGGVLMDPGA